MNENRNDVQRRNYDERRHEKDEHRHSSLSFFHPFFDILSDNFFDDDNVDLMKTDVKDEGNNYKLEVEIPGVDKKDVKLSLDNGYLTVAASFNRSSKEGEGKYIHYERSSGSYSRSFYVGSSVKKSDINASTNNGVLTITFPKSNAEKEEEDKYIEIK